MNLSPNFYDDFLVTSKEADESRGFLWMYIGQRTYHEDTNLCFRCQKLYPNQKCTHCNKLICKNCWNYCNTCKQPFCTNCLDEIDTPSGPSYYCLNCSPIDHPTINIQFTPHTH